MKYIDSDQIEPLLEKQVKPGETFQFRCHPEVSCFNVCCRNLNLFLYPYDIIRLKKSLRLSSDQFIDRYVDIVMRPDNFFPEVLLKMADNTEKTCPFLSARGCRVYADRPDACRTFPVEKGLYYDAATRTTEAIYFFKPPDFCQGQYEKQPFTIDTWIQDQQVQYYHQMNDLWSGVKRLFQNDPWGDEGPHGPRARMAFMAAYNIDPFRTFVLQSSFLKRYRIKPAVRKKIKTDDVALMKLGFEWMKHYLFGIPVDLIQTD